MPNAIPLKPTQQVSIGFLLYGYAVILSGAFTFAFWQPFNFDPFPFLSMHDVVTGPLGNLVLLLGPFLGVYIPLILRNKSLFDDRRLFHVLALAHVALFLAYALKGGYLVAANYRDTSDGLPLYLAVLFAILSLGLGRISIREGHAFHFSVSSLICIQIGIVLAGGFYLGKRAISESNLTKSKLDAYSLNEISLCGTDGKAPWIYLNHYGDFSIFFSRSSRSLCFTDSKNYTLSPIQFHLKQFVH